MKAGFRALSFANLSVLTAPALLAQDCSIPFTEPMFGVQQEMDILYGSSVRYNGTTQELRLNLFKPVDDEQTQRPLIILIPGGGFFDGDRRMRDDHQLAALGRGHHQLSAGLLCSVAAQLAVRL